MSNFHDDVQRHIESRRGNYGVHYLVKAVNTFMEEFRCTLDQAIEGICEGHELSRESETALREALEVRI